MKDYTKECWYCGSKAVYPFKTWFECLECGATYVPQITVRPAIIESGNVWENGDTVRPTRRAKHPTPAAVREVQRAKKVKG